VNTAVFGASNGAIGGVVRGAVYVYVKNEIWTLEAKLNASDGTSGDGFGGTIAIDGDILMVAAPNKDPVSLQGAVYVFTRSNGVWTEQGKLQLPTDCVFGCFFGNSMAINNGSLIIGTDYRDMVYP
jgi:hypothetical protein